MKLYVIVNESLATGLKMAQACHALVAFTQAYPEITSEWMHDNNIVVLSSH
jgi:hypothetical protein